MGSDRDRARTRPRDPGKQALGKAKEAGRDLKEGLKDAGRRR
jgi:hypothetical protein